MSAVKRTSFSCANRVQNFASGEHPAPSGRVTHAIKTTGTGRETAKEALRRSKKGISRFSWRVAVLCFSHSIASANPEIEHIKGLSYVVGAVRNGAGKRNEMIEHGRMLQGLDAGKMFGFAGLDDCYGKFVPFESNMIQPDREMSLKEGDHPCPDQ